VLRHAFSSLQRQKRRRGVVGDHAETNPALHAGVAFVATAVETMSAFDHADAALTADAPFCRLTVSSNGRPSRGKKPSSPTPSL
jgi:hypothetical protein